MRRFFKTILTIGILAIIAVSAVLGYRNYKHLKQVHQYDSQVAQSAETYQLTKYQDLISAIIFTESKGSGADVMQSSESRYGNTGAITTTAESIDTGVRYLSQAILKATQAGCDLNTAIQAYNFGLDYIDYIKERGGKNTVELAESYSKDILSPMLGNQEKSQYRYWGLHSMFYNGGYLYHNGGNFFYAEVVNFNEWKIAHTKFLF